MNLLDLFGAYLGIMTMGFMFLPALQVLEWKKKGTTGGYSSVQFVLPCLMMSCWMCHGLLTGDPLNTYLNAFSLIVSSVYILAFAYYTPDIKYLAYQVTGLVALLVAIFVYVFACPKEEQIDTMGKIAAIAQNAGLVGALVQLKQVFETKTTEFVPAEMQFGILFIVGQWTVFAVLSGNMYMAAGNLPGIVLALFTIGLYYVYPPLTWKVPILGVGHAQKMDEKKKK